MRKKEIFYRPVCSRCESVTHEPSEEGGLPDSELSAQNHFLLRDLHTCHFPWLASLASLLLVFSYVLLHLKSISAHIALHSLLLESEGRPGLVWGVSKSEQTEDNS